MPPLSESDLIFSSASYSIGKTLKELNRANLSVSNRLHSIKSDSDFVLKVAEAYQLPLIANERCGSWYIPPDRKAGSAYFKSTDGHSGQWSFSLRRLNVQVLDVVGRHGGCVIVDSTRRGKSMPDALSKTVPVWVAVLNRLLFPAEGERQILVTPLDVVSRSEHQQIEERMDGFVRGALDLELDAEALKRRLNSKPMEIVWHRPGDVFPDESARNPERNLVVLCTASNQTSNETAATSNYVQGAADDSESWALGLDAASFWQYSAWLLNAPEHELSELIKSVVSTNRSQTPRSASTVTPTVNLWIGNNGTAEQTHEDFDVLVSCDTSPNTTWRERKGERYVHLQCATGKNGSRQLRTELLKTDILQVILQPDSKILVTCQTGRDMAVGVALAILCLYYDENGRITTELGPIEQPINKTLIKQRRSWIMVSMPDAAPSRATLQSVNAYLMDV